MLKYKWFKQRIDTLFAPGFKIWSKGIPLKLDLYQNCSNFCRACFAISLRNMTLGRNGIKQNLQVARLLNMRSLVNFFNKAFAKKDTVHPFMNWALRNKYFLELGTTGETFQECDLDFRLTYNFLKLTSDLQIPILTNTKLNLLCRDDEYKKLLINHKAPIFLEVSLSTTDDKLAKIYEPLAPLPSERLKTMKELSKYDNIIVSVYISPFMPGVTDLDPEKFINDIMDANAQCAHLRDFFMQGEMFQSNFWKNYIRENESSIETFPGGHHVRYDAKLKFLEETTRIAIKRNPLFRIIGMKTRFLDMEVYYGRGMMDIFPDSFKKGIVDFTIIPILRKIKENRNSPQLLLWDKIGYKKDKISYPEYIRTNEGDINNLIDWGCSCNKSEVEMRIEGFTWIRDGLWNGFGVSSPAFISKIEGIYPVKDVAGNYVKDGEDSVYVYIPEKFNYLLKSSTHQSFLLAPDIKDLKEPYILETDTRDFIRPERLGGTEDKWVTKEKLLEAVR